MPWTSRRWAPEKKLGSSSRSPCPRTTPGKYAYLFDPFRWIVYDLEYKEDDGRKVSKLVLILYSPDENNDNAEKFVVACNKDQLKSKIPETNRDWQINKWDDLVEENLIKQFL